MEESRYSYLDIKDNESIQIIDLPASADLKYACMLIKMPPIDESKTLSCPIYPIVMIFNGLYWQECRLSDEVETILGNIYLKHTHILKINTWYNFIIVDKE